MIQRPDASATQLLARLKMEQHAIRDDARMHERGHIGKTAELKGLLPQGHKKGITHACILDEYGCCDIAESLVQAQKWRILEGRWRTGLRKHVCVCGDGAGTKLLAVLNGSG